MLALEAMCEEPFNLYGIQATTHPVAPLVIVNGPGARELGLNGGHNAFGPGTHGNATLGRAIRLALLNIGGAIPGAGDMSTFGAPSKYSYFVAENEAASPWEPLHVERGFPADATTVTVIGGRMPAQRERPREHERRRHSHDHCGNDGDDRVTTTSSTTRNRWWSSDRNTRRRSPTAGSQRRM